MFVILGVLLTINQKKELTRDDLQKQITTTEATLSEVGLVLQTAKDNKITEQFLSVYIEDLIQQLQQSQQKLTNTSFQPQIKSKGEEQIQVTNTSIRALLYLQSNIKNKKSLILTQKTIADTFKKESIIEKTL